MVFIYFLTVNFSILFALTTSGQLMIRTVDGLANRCLSRPPGVNITAPNPGICQYPLPWEDDVSVDMRNPGHQNHELKMNFCNSRRLFGGVQTIYKKLIF